MQPIFEFPRKSNNSSSLFFKDVYLGFCFVCFCRRLHRKMNNFLLLIPQISMIKNFLYFALWLNAQSKTLISNGLCYLRCHRFFTAKELFYGAVMTRQTKRLDLLLCATQFAAVQQLNKPCKKKETIFHRRWSDKFLQPLFLFTIK